MVTTDVTNVTTEVLYKGKNSLWEKLKAVKKVNEIIWKKLKAEMNDKVKGKGKGKGKDKGSCDHEPEGA